MCIYICPISVCHHHNSEGHQRLEQRYRELMELLGTIERIQSDEQLQTVGRKLEQLLELLPGPRTPERLARIDAGGADDQWKKFAAEKYPDLLEALVDRFDAQFPGKVPDVDGRICRIFSLDDNAGFVVESLTMLTDGGKLQRNREVFPFLLSRLVQDGEHLAGCFVELSLGSLEENALTKHDRLMKSEQLVQILSSIPNKLANVLQRETPDLFLPEGFFQLMLQQILRAIHSLSHITNLHHNLTCDSTFLSKFLSKLIVDFNSSSDKRCSDPLRLTLRILTTWAQNQNDSHQRTLIAPICSHLSRRAVEIIALIALREAEGSIDLSHLLRVEDLTRGEWRYVLTQKIPLFSSFPDNSVVENLIYLLARVSDNESSDQDQESPLKDLTRELLTVWSSRASIQRTSFEQHLYVSKLVLLAISYLSVFRVKKLSGGDVREFRKLLFAGLKCHLESPVKQIRCVGMVVSEEILEFFDEKEIKEEDRLKFDYEGFDKDTLELIEMLKKYKLRCKFVDDELSQEIIKSDEESLDQLVEKLFESDGSLDVVIPVYSSSKPEEPSVTEIEVLTMTSTSIKTPLGKRSHDSDDSELDSDDDLEPYDMSHDTKIAQEQHRPKYLLDLREILLDNSDQQAPERFELAIQAAPELIEQQLPDNDIKLALDLLQLFLTLECRYYMENFQELKFSSLIGICSTYPKECAEYLCREFHSDLSKYSLNRRILMLDILAQTAKVLANLDPSKKSTQHPEPTEPTPASPSKNTLELKFQNENQFLRKRQLAERIVRERIESKTRRFSSRTNPTKTTTSGTINRFSAVAGYFFFPLLRGFGSKQFLFTANLKFQYDSDNLLLTTFLQTLSILMICAENCPIGRKFARELLNLSVLMRFSEEPKVRLSVLQLLSSIFLALPKEVLRQDFYLELVELKQWLEECVQGSVVRGEANEECREFARHVLVMCYNVLKED